MKNNRMKFTVRILKLFMIAVLGYNLSMDLKAFAATGFYNEWTSKQEVKQDKVWSVKFNSPLNEKTIIDSSIRVRNNRTGKRIDIIKTFDSEKNIVYVKPVSKYNPGETYTMYIEDDIKNIKGDKLEEPIKFKFTIENQGGTSHNSIITTSEEFEKTIKNALTNFEDNITLRIDNFSNDKYNLDVVKKILRENPNIDYGYEGVSLLSFNGVTISFEYQCPKETMLSMKKAAEAKAQEIIINVITEDMTDYEKELALHDYVVNNSQYDEKVYEGGAPRESYTDYGILVKGVGVCAGYARAMHRLLNAAGIECYYVVGEGNGGAHAWNIVKIGGEYYHLDTTWDDPVSSDGRANLSHTYFNLSDEQISKDHSWNGDYPKCTSTTHN